MNAMTLDVDIPHRGAELSTPSREMPLDDPSVHYRLRQRVRFAPLRTALADCIATVYPSYAQYVLTDDDAYIELGRHHGGDWLPDLKWRVVPNFELDALGGAGAHALREAPGFRLEEIAYLRGVQTRLQHKSEVLADVPAVCAYLKDRWGVQRG